MCKYLVELSRKSLKEGQNNGFDHFVTKLYVESWLACRVLEQNLKVGELLGPSIPPTKR